MEQYKVFLKKKFLRRFWIKQQQQQWQLLTCQTF